MNVDAGIDDDAAIGSNLVLGSIVASGIDIVPVHLITHTVDAGLRAGRNDKRRRCERRFLRNIIALAVLFLVQRVGHKFLGINHAVVVILHIKESVVVQIDVGITAHPSNYRRKTRRHRLSRLGEEAVVETLDIKHTVGTLVHFHGLLSVAAVKGHGISVASGAGNALCLTEINWVEPACLCMNGI